MNRPRPVLRWLARLGWLLVATLLLAVLAGAGVLLRLVPAADPIVNQTEAIELPDVERALRLARQHDPRHAIPGVVRTLRLSQHEAELLLNHTAARIRPSRWKLELGADRLQLRGSLRLPDNPFGDWLNLDLQARQTRGLPQLESVRLGRLNLPLPLVDWLVDRVASHYGLSDWRSAGVVSVQQVRLAPRRIDVVYAWGPDAGARVLAALLPAQEHERLRTYAAHLAQVAASAPAGQVWSLSQLLPPMFDLARQRSAQGQNPALENRAALMVLGMVANGVGLATLLPERRDELAARPIRLTLGGRQDFPQHFLVSATLAAEGGTPLADRIGLFKELSDARSGSGFSFNDMAANRAGTRLGELAVQQPQKLQATLARGVVETDILPRWDDLPEFMPEPEFVRRFGGIGAPPYLAMIEEIDRRVGALPVLR